jgi:hypothetical protein
MKETDTVQLSGYSFVETFDSRFARVSYLEELKIVIVEMKAEYVPIEHFKDTFHHAGELVRAGYDAKFIFDKRALRAFHQPSMEWYYVVWKRDMLAHGLRVHRKLLPNEPWFQKSVMIAKEQIHRQYPDNVIDQLDIQYCDTLEAAITT